MHFVRYRYHNFKHAFDCAHTVRVFFDAFGLSSRFSQLETLAVLVAAILHDVGHPGLNNTFHVKQQTTLALRYNDRSVLESVSPYAVQVPPIAIQGVLILTQTESN